MLNLGVVTITSSDRTLPAKLTLAGTEANVTWSLGSVASAKTAAELGTFAATGRSTEKLSSGLYQRFSATVLVVPADLEYFIDSGASGAPAGSVYAAVKAAVPDLLNDTSDQKWDGTDGRNDVGLLDHRDDPRGRARRRTGARRTSAPTSTSRSPTT